jgi:hypothetical protein
VYLRLFRGGISNRCRRAAAAAGLGLILKNAPPVYSKLIYHPR